MIVRCWGARGSIPVSGREHLKYGGDTTCMEIRTKHDDIIIVDAGSGMRRLGNSLIHEGRFNYHLIMTHAHWDHLMGFPFFKPIYFKKTTINVYGCPYAHTSLKQIFSRLMAPPNFPVNFESIRANIVYREACDQEFTIKSTAVSQISLSHPNGGEGYKFVEDGKSFVFLTDNELTYKHPGGMDYQDYKKFSAGADLLIHDAEFKAAEYKKTYKWGHSVYLDALELAMEAGVKKFGLFHHNQERSDKAVDEIVKDCRRIIKARRSRLKCFAVHQNMEIEL